MHFDSWAHPSHTKLPSWPCIARLFPLVELLTMVLAISAPGKVIVNAAGGRVLLLHPASCGTPERSLPLSIKVQRGLPRIGFPSSRNVMPITIQPVQAVPRLLI